MPPPFCGIFFSYFLAELLKSVSEKVGKEIYLIGKDGMKKAGSHLWL